MMRLRHAGRGVLFALLLVMVLTAVCPLRVSAGISRVPSHSADGGSSAGSGKKSHGIQSGGSLVSDKKLYGEDAKEDAVKEFTEKETSTLTKLLMKPFVWIGNFLRWLCEKSGMTMENIVFGRIGGRGVYLNKYRVNLFGFELKTGNIYGMVGGAIYAGIRGVIYVALTCMLLAKVVKASYSGNGTKALTALKDGVSNSILAFLLLGLMPYFLDLFLYLRDVLLNYTGLVMPHRFFGIDAGGSVSDVFYTLREDGPINCLMYIASSGLNVYFAWTYIMVAVSFTVSFLAFPFVCLNMQFDRNALGTWIKSIVGYALVPVVDSALLLIPAYIGTYSNGSVAFGVVQTMVCFAIVPARAALRTALGLSSSMGMELAGIGALMMAGRFAKSMVGNTVGRISGAMGARRQRLDNEEMAKTYDSLAGAEGVSNISSDGHISNPEGSVSLASGEEAGGVAVGGHLVNPSGVSNAGSEVGSASAMAGEAAAGQTRGVKTFDDVANWRNFENPAIANKISYAKRAELLREKNRRLYGKHGGKTIWKTVGGVAGGIYGGVAGAAMGGMIGPAVSMGLGAAGASIGGGLGDNLGALGYMAGRAAGTKAGDAYHFIKGRFGQRSNGGELGSVGELAPYGEEMAVSGLSTPNVADESTQVNMSYGSYQAYAAFTGLANDEGTNNGYVMSMTATQVKHDFINKGASMFNDQHHSAEVQKLYRSVKDAGNAGNGKMSSEQQRQMFNSGLADMMTKEYESRVMKDYRSHRIKSTGINSVDMGAMGAVNSKIKRNFEKALNEDKDGAYRDILSGWNFTFDD